MLWSPQIQILETTDGLPRLVMRHPVPGGHVVHTFDFLPDETLGFIEIPDPVKGRFLCHLVLTKIPDEGIPEALESLGQMYHFYRAPVTHAPTLPVTQATQARYGASTVAPVFPVSEE